MISVKIFKFLWIGYGSYEEVWNNGKMVGKELKDVCRELRCQYDIYECSTAVNERNSLGGIKMDLELPVTRLIWFRYNLKFCIPFIFI